MAVPPEKRRAQPVTRTILHPDMRDKVLAMCDGDLRRVQNLQLDGETVMDVLILNKPRSSK